MTLYAYVGWGMSLVAAIAVGLLIGSIPRKRKETEIVSAARDEAEQLKKEKLLEARQEVQELREEVEERAKRREEEITRAEERILRREDRLSKKSTYLEKIEDSLREDEEELLKLEKHSGETGETVEVKVLPVEVPFLSEERHVCLVYPGRRSR